MCGDRAIRIAIGFTPLQRFPLVGLQLAPANGNF
jgi:hypothetical protein